MRRLIVLMFFSLLGALSACASAPPTPARLALPTLQLLPSALVISEATSLTLAQRLTLVRVNDATRLPASTPRGLDVLLEIDAQSVQLAGFALGQRLLKLNWDGKILQSTRHALLPAEVDAVRVLRDVQLVYWPVQAVRAALPDGWTVEDQLNEQTATRVLKHAGELQVEIKYAGVPRWNGQAQLDNRVEGYVLTIDSKLED